MTYQPLKTLGIGLGSTVALLLAGAQANAAPCPGEMTVASIEATPGFSCTFGDKSLTGFSFNSAVPGTAFVDIGVHGPDFSVSLNNDGTFFPTGSLPNLLDYTISEAPGHPGVTMAFVTLGVDVSVPGVTTWATEVGNNSGSATLGPVTNGGTVTATVNPGDTRIVVTNDSSSTSQGQLNEVTNDFSMRGPVGVPEPMSITLFGLGLAGLWFAVRRRS